jgi:putative transposase
LNGRGIRISMDGRGRVFDNIFVERLWRYVKGEEVYLKDYACVQDAIDNLRAYFILYNQYRLHQALDYSIPQQVYFSTNSAVELRS